MRHLHPYVYADPPPPSPSSSDPAPLLASLSPSSPASCGLPPLPFHAHVYTPRVPRKERRNLPWAGQDELKVVLPCPSMRGENPSWLTDRQFCGSQNSHAKSLKSSTLLPCISPLFPFSKYYVPNVIPACTSLLYLRAIRDVYEEVPIQSWADDICLVTYTISV
ncbi:hypothetical protein B0H13DRAFT_2324075 [Mycena leptocephala]|nr:hypothetical protein B0H13DRAFT_2324075 [Mycena leptocephala]